MLFSSIVFLYCFLPALLIFCLLFRRAGKNAVLFFFSLLFYAWGEPKYLFLMLGAIIAGYLFGLALARWRSRLLLGAACGVFVALLAFFKYTDFTLASLGSLLGLELPLLKLALPAGISFYLFQILSYEVDVYRGDYPAERNFLRFATYVSLFPQLIAGPIVRYSEVASALRERRIRLQDFASGTQRFLLGLGKKLLIADVLGGLCQLYGRQDTPSVLFTWLYVVAFTFQLYFDFSGYSDMAIGLGQMLGFRFPENFNYPYIARSVTDFWRRWHMTLSGWFRDYVYIPLGGNRVRTALWIRNLLLVWALTGLWHGAGWNFLLWGLWYGLLLLLEKLILGKVFEKCRPLGHLYAALGILFGWVLFDASSLPAAWHTVQRMFGGAAAVDGVSLYYLKSYAAVLLLAAIGATPLLKKLLSRVNATRAGRAVLCVASPLALAAILLLCTAYLVDGSFQPFLYFRF